MTDDDGVWVFGHEYVLEVNIGLDNKTHVYQGRVWAAYLKQIPPRKLK